MPITADRPPSLSGFAPSDLCRIALTSKAASGSTMARTPSARPLFSAYPRAFSAPVSAIPHEASYAERAQSAPRVIRAFLSFSALPPPAPRRSAGAGRRAEARCRAQPTGRRRSAASRRAICAGLRSRARLRAEARWSERRVCALRSMRPGRSVLCRNTPSQNYVSPAHFLRSTRLRAKHLNAEPRSI